ncbi:MAG: Gfo/Idh/MocA family oxidoreductase [Ignavibacteria bacterium]
MKNRVNLGIIGCGTVSRLMHLPALLKYKNKFNIVSLYDIEESALSLTRKLFNPQKKINFAKSPAEILSNPEIDAVAILTSTSSHVKYTLIALQNKKHVFLEKPAAVLPRDIEKIIQSEKKYKRFCQVGMVLRYSSFYKELRRIISSGKFGKVLWMNWLETRPFDPMLWRYNNTRVNGDAIIHDKAVHQINLFNQFAGSKASEVMAMGGQYLINPKTYSKVRAFSSGVKLKGESNDNLMAIIKYKNGVKASLTVSYVSPHARESRWVIQLEEAKLVAHFETFVHSNNSTKRKWKGNPSSIYLFKDDLKYPVVWKYPMSYPPSDKNLIFYDEYPGEPMHPGSGAQWEAFYNTVTKNIKPESSTQIALQDIVVAKAIDDSIKKKRVIWI